MNRVKTNLFGKSLAVIISILIIISAMPTAMFSVSAATENLPDAITISVVDTEGNPIAGADVEFDVDSLLNGEKYISKTEKTDGNGSVSVMPSADFVENDFTLTAKVTKDKYRQKNSVNSVEITSEKQDFKITLESTVINDITVIPTDIKYDGKEHAAAVVNYPTDKYEVQYKLDDGEWQSEMPKIKEIKEYTLYVKAEKEGYEPYSTTVKPVISINTIELTVTEYKGDYDQEYHPALSIVGLQDDDKVTYKLNDGEEVSSIPQIIDVAKYTVTVTVERYGYEKYNKVFSNIEIIATKINGVTASANRYVYDGQLHDAVTVSEEGLKIADKVEYKLESGEWTEEVPQISEVGEYSVFVRISKKNYTQTDVEVVPAKAIITKATQTLEFKNDEYNNSVSDTVVLDKENDENNIYDFAAIGDKTQVDSEITYSVASSSTGAATIDVDGKLTVTKAGSIVVEAKKPGNASYEDTTISFTLMVTENSDGLVYFDEPSLNYILGTNNGVVSKISAKKKNSDDNGELTYSIDKTTIGLTCEPDGKVVVSDYQKLADSLKEGKGTVSLFVNVKKGKGTEDVTVEKSTISVYFSDAKNWGNVYIHYWGDGSVKGTAFPGVKMEYTGSKNEYNQKIYKCDIPKNVTGIVFSNGTNAEQTVDINRRIVKNTGFYVTSKNGNRWNYGTYPYGSSESSTETIKYDKYVESKASYVINVSFAEVPETPYVLEGTKGTNDWYTSSVIAKATDGSAYSISKTPIPDDFVKNVTFDNQGTDSRYVYLMNIKEDATDKGAITSPIELTGVKIDTVTPQDLEITYSDPIENTWWDNLLEALTLGFYNSKEENTVITFKATDVTSGIDHFNWSYTKEDGVSDSNQESIENKPLDVSIEGNVATATIELPLNENEQMRGCISFTATDKAGNISKEKTDDGKTIVIDSINPECSVSYSDCKKTVGTQMYYDDTVTTTLTVKEANFFKEDVIVSISKDGNTPYKVSSINWSKKDADTNIGTFEISGDGDYVVNVEYTDKSNNKMTSYTSDVITIDTINPIVDFTYSKDKQETTFTVIEHNFRPEDISVDVIAKDINGNDITEHGLQHELRNADWTDNGDTHTYTTSGYVDARYNLTISYKDISQRDSNAKTTGEFIIDHTKPTDVEISYSKSIVNTLLENVTLGFYNPDVTVTFTSYDVTSGVNSFTWDYTREIGASEVNRKSDEEVHTLDATQDATDHSKFTASITLPEKEAEQLRGYFASTSTDTYNNTSNKVTDSGKVIVLDTIAPTMQVEYSPASRMVGSNMYYNDTVTATFKVTEANFFSDDVKVSVTKNDKSFTGYKLSWVDNSVDEHIGTLVLDAPKDGSNDGHYVISVEYTDKSKNTMESYKSDIITIDTIAPTVNVSYDNKKAVNTLTDAEKHDREYFDDTQTATITIDEHNFTSDEVEIEIVAKDVTGKDITKDIESKIKKSEWKTKGDKHTIVITYSADANYTFDIAYTDLATNKMADYKKDYFTVDKTAPTNLSVSYSRSVLDTVLENVSFGFYNAKVTVTISATDNTSKINKFDYSYINAANISPVNAQLLDQILKESVIKYSENDRVATTTFEIPKDVLASNNQFNGTVEFIAYDRSGNNTENKDSKRVVVDNISPTINVEYSQPVNTMGSVRYYDGNINGTITVNEANFYSSDVEVGATIDGRSTPVNVTWTDDSNDVHTGRFTLTADGDYFVTINYTDKSGNRMDTYRSEQLTIDTTIDKPSITINGKQDVDGTAYKDEVIPAISFMDENLDTYEVKLTRTRRGEKNVDVTEEFTGGLFNPNNKGGSGSFDTFKKIAENDGIYNLRVSITDKANHSEEASITFTVNRFGSVYEYNDYLVSLIDEGGSYVQKVTDDFVITEYNADRLVKDSLNIEVTRDGKPLENLKFTAAPAINERTAIGSSGWYQYEYVISKDNFMNGKDAIDGIYKITVSSKDATGNSPENNNYDDRVITFRVDDTVPEITSIVGLEESIINAQEVAVKYTVYDTIGLQSITVYVDGEKYGKEITDFKKDLNNYNGQFVLKEKSAAQSVRLVVKDLAGNVTDTETEEFTKNCKYAFNGLVTVSTNFFVRWYANTPLFWGSIGGFVIVAGGITFLIVSKLRKKKTVAE